MKIAIHNKIVFQDATLRYDSERQPEICPSHIPERHHTIRNRYGPSGCPSVPEKVFPISCHIAQPPPMVKPLYNIYIKA